MDIVRDNVYASALEVVPPSVPSVREGHRGALGLKGLGCQIRLGGAFGIASVLQRDGLCVELLLAAVGGVLAVRRGVLERGGVRALEHDVRAEDVLAPRGHCAPLVVRVVRENNRFAACRDQRAARGAGSGGLLRVREEEGGVSACSTCGALELQDGPLVGQGAVQSSKRHPVSRSANHRTLVSQSTSLFDMNERLTLQFAGDEPPAITGRLSTKCRP